MKCPVCGTWSVVLETKQGEHTPYQRRRRLCSNQHKFSTREYVTRVEGVRLPRPGGIVDDKGGVARVRPSPYLKTP